MPTCVPAVLASAMACSVLLLARGATVWLTAILGGASTALGAGAAPSPGARAGGEAGATQGPGGWR